MIPALVRVGNPRHAVPTALMTSPTCNDNWPNCSRGWRLQELPSCRCNRGAVVPDRVVVTGCLGTTTASTMLSTMTRSMSWTIAAMEVGAPARLKLRLVQVLGAEDRRLGPATANISNSMRSGDGRARRQPTRPVLSNHTPAIHPTPRMHRNDLAMALA